MKKYLVLTCLFLASLFGATASYAGLYEGIWQINDTSRFYVVIRQTDTASVFMLLKSDGSEWLYGAGTIDGNQGNFSAAKTPSMTNPYLSGGAVTVNTNFISPNEALVTLTSCQVLPSPVNKSKGRSSPICPTPIGSSFTIKRLI